MAFSSIAAATESYNLLPFYDFGEIAVDMSFSSVQYVLPFMMAVIYYLLYRIYARMITNSVNSAMRAYSKTISIDGVRRIIDIGFIVLCIFIGIIEYMFYLFPIWSKLLKTLLKEIFVFLTILYMNKGLSKGLDKECAPLIFKALLMPSVFLVVLI